MHPTMQVRCPKFPRELIDMQLGVGRRVAELAACTSLFPSKSQDLSQGTGSLQRTAPANALLKAAEEI